MDILSMNNKIFGWAGPMLFLWMPQILFVKTAAESHIKNARIFFHLPPNSKQLSPVQIWLQWNVNSTTMCLYYSYNFALFLSQDNGGIWQSHFAWVARFTIKKPEYVSALSECSDDRGHYIKQFWQHLVSKQSFVSFKPVQQSFMHSFIIWRSENYQILFSR